MQVFQKIRILIADDHEVYLDGLKSILSQESKYNIIGAVRNGKELVHAVLQHQPDIVLTDIKMPVMDGIAATRLIRKNHPETNVIAMSVSNDEMLISQTLEAGALGYLLKDVNKNEIFQAIEAVYQQIPYYCKTIARQLHLSLAHYRPASGYASNALLSDREKDVIRLICKEYSTKEISERLNQSVRTVEGYRRFILRKLNVKSTAGIVLYAVKNGLHQ